jgi:hypothetical protein
MSASPRPRRRTEAAAQQLHYRQQQKALRKPSRDDVARVTLHWLIQRILKHDKEGELARWCETIVRRLVRQGFERDAARSRVNQLIERYENGWRFQRKPHLAHDDDD